MRALEKTFKELQSQGRKAFIAYITAGDPDIQATVRLVRELEAGGVDIIELGIPFSDPIADGPVNQAAAQRALKNDINLGMILDAVKTIRQDSDIPIVFFSYINPIIAYGMERFASDAKASGLSGALILDMPPEEAGDYKILMEDNNLDTIFLVSPITPVDRIDLIVKHASGFVYYVSQMGVTGERNDVSETIPQMVEEIKSRTDIPVAVGFGISTPDQVRGIAEHADGVIVGSSIVKRIGEKGIHSGFEKEIGAYVKTLTAPLKGEQ
ncbi:tryptophan synthase subunit alpha [Candidatus Latescibacterota bacterium]